jgi:Raf kinase inhibitor-like YbhB/YbcL family protein
MRNRDLAIVLGWVAVGAAAPAWAEMTLTSPDIRPDGAIGQAFVYPRCGGANQSPQLAWSGAPPGTHNLVLTMIDESVKPAGWSHWIVVGLPAGTTGLTRGIKTLPGGARAVAGNFGDAAYDGPCPPAGSGPHRYRFTIWALPGPAPAIAPNSDAVAAAMALKRQAIGSASFVGVVER